MVDKIIQSPPRMPGKSTLVTDAFLADCKAGKSVIYQHPDYVALSRKSYEALVEKTKEEKSIEDQVYDAIVSAFQFDSEGYLLVSKR